MLPAHRGSAIEQAIVGQLQPSPVGHATIGTIIKTMYCAKKTCIQIILENRASATCSSEVGNAKQIAIDFDQLGIPKRTVGIIKVLQNGK